MYFGLIETTREWYQTDVAYRRFARFSLLIASISIIDIYFYLSPTLLVGFRNSTLGSAAVALTGIVLSFAILGLIFGMGWYWWFFDKSPIWVKILWLAGALVLSPLVQIAYLLLVYRPQTPQMRAGASLK